MSWLERLYVKYICGDLFSMEVDAIVCTVTNELGAYGALSRHLFNIGGPYLADDINKIKEGLLNKRLELGQSVTLHNKKELNLPKVDKIILTAFWDISNDYTPNLIYRAHINSLREAFNHKVKTIALPVMAAGGLEILSSGIVKVLYDLDELRNSDTFSIEELYFVSNKQSHVDCLEGYINNRL